MRDQQHPHRDHKVHLMKETSWRSDGLLCALAAVLVPLLAFPFAEIGFMDDFSYIRSSQVFSQTGHLAYNGWATAMLGWQIPWGALFLKVLGFSFTAARLSTVVSTFLLISLFHAVAVRFGLNRRHAIFASLLLGLSPVLIPLSFSFMTDVNGLLVLVVCLYMCLRTLEAESRARAFTWLTMAAVIDVIGGTARQVAWVGVLAIVPATAWLIRKRRGALLLGAALWMLGVLSIVWVSRWWAHQPGAMAEELMPKYASVMSLVTSTVSVSLRSLLCLGFLLLPLLAEWILRIRLFPRLLQIALLSATALYAAASVVLLHKKDFEFHVLPWIGNITMDEFYASEHIWMLTNRPVPLPWLRIAVSSVVFLAILCAAVDTIRHSRRPWFEGLLKAPSRSWLLVAYAAAYAALLLPRAMHFVMLDRYLLGLMIPASILILRFHQQAIAPRQSGLGLAVLVLLAAFGIAGTHDLFAQYRANIRATDTLMQAGVPRNHIEGGEEFDGWTQIEAQGYLHDPRILNVAPAFKDTAQDFHLPEKCTLNFLKQTPVVTPDYFTATDEMPCLQTSRFGAVEYRAWLPPFRRRVWILERPGMAEGQ
jgi:hypothetical protein